ncbi:aldehyde dehydrogenase family protein, partial [Thiotrichales bacterium HSG1]|nr:aldehyde dehydrogenase family protein [Thiotrichales bacterium HSG1]
MQLQNSNLFQQQAYINGSWVGSEQVIEVTNPANNSILGTIPNFGKDEARTAIEAAHVAGIEWRSKLAKERSTLLRNWFNLIMQN